jgi:hypothetical protein
MIAAMTTQSLPSRSARCLCATLHVALVAAALLVGSASANTVLTGTTPSGANYTIRVPEGWQPGGPLVMVNHGYSFDFDNDVSSGPLVDVQLAQGYAVAASGFRTGGWALFDAIDDNWELYQRFVQLVGEPGTVIAAGGSMGGLVSLKQAEDRRFVDRIDAVYALCPPAAGSRAWEAGFDLKLGYDAICQGVGGGEFPRGDEPLPWVLNLADIPEDLSDLSLGSPMLRALSRIQQCTGLLGPSWLRTPPQRDRLADLKRTSGIDDEDFLALNLGYAIFGLADLVRGPAKLAGSNPFDNLGVSYTRGLGPFRDPAFESRLSRVAREPFATVRLRESSDLRGAGRAPIVSLHTSGDQLTIPEHQETLRALYPPSRLLSAIVSETQPTHCEFSRAELVSGWNATREAAAGTPLPSVADLQLRCTALAASGAEPGPCRIDARAKVGPLDARIRPRITAPTFRPGGIWTAAGANPTAPDVLLVHEVERREALGPPVKGEVRVAWHAWLRDLLSGALVPRWVVGDGERYGNAIVVRDARVGSGGRFGTPWTASDEATATFGRVEIWLDPALANGEPASVGRASVRVIGPSPLGLSSRTQRYQQTRILGPSTALTAQAPLPPEALLIPFAEAGWFADGFGGQLALTLSDRGSAGNIIAGRIDWFTFDRDGRPVHLYGEADAAIQGAWRVAMRRADPLDPAGLPWGEITLSAPPCDDSASLRWSSLDPAFGVGETAAPRMRTAFPNGCRSP